MYERFDSPWPMKDRELFVQVAMYKVPDEDALVFSFESVEGDDWFGTPIKRDKKNAVEMLFNKSFGYLKPMGPNKSLFKFIINADPQLDYIPPGIIDWGIKTVSGGFISYLVQSCTDLPSMYMKRYKEKKDLYD